MQVQSMSIMYTQVQAQKHIEGALINAHTYSYSPNLWCRLEKLRQRSCRKPRPPASLLVQEKQSRAAPPAAKSRAPWTIGQIRAVATRPAAAPAPLPVQRPAPSSAVVPVATMVLHLATLAVAQPEAAPTTKSAPVLPKTHTPYRCGTTTLPLLLFPHSLRRSQHHLVSMELVHDKQQRPLRSAPTTFTPLN